MRDTSGCRSNSPSSKAAASPCLRTSSSSSPFTFSTTLLDAGRVDATVGDEPLDGLPRDLPAVRVEAREDDRAGRVVDDQLDARRLLERADVAALAADDPPLHVVAGQVDHGDRRLDGVLGGAALDGLGDDLPGLRGRHLARFVLEPLDQVGRVASRVGLDLPQQQVLGLVRREPGDALQLALLVGDQPLVALGGAAWRSSRGRAIVFSRCRSSLSARSAAAMRSASACVRCGEPLLGPLRLAPGAPGPGARPRRARRARAPWPRAAPPSAWSRLPAGRRAGAARPAARRGRPSRRQCACDWRPRRRTPRAAAMRATRNSRR